MKHRKAAATLSLLASLSLAAPSVALAEGRDLTELSLEALMNVEVTSVSKREQPLSETAAAVYVLSRDEIRRSGMTTIPEVLRLVPGLEVARIDANKWAVSSRGFLYRFANKMLVLVDGRSVYTPQFGGVYWDIQDTVLEDIDRIEVIRGPGATLWGANAVNGVINIVTRQASETHGGLVVAAAGSHETQAALRYGGRSGALDWRAYGRFFDHSAFASPGGGEAEDPYDLTRAGFRLDWQSENADSWTVQGDVYDGTSREETVLPVFGPPYAALTRGDAELEGHHLLARWERSPSAESGFSVQGYYDSTRRVELRGVEERDTYDLDFHRRQSSGKHNVVWGLGLRHTSDRIVNSDYIAFSPTERTDRVYSAFLQDDVVFRDGKLRLTYGSKFERNDYTGFEFQPNVRLFGKLGDKHVVWGSLARAVRTPTRTYEDAVAYVAAFPDPMSGMTTVVGFEGSTDNASEILLAHEFGYRFLGSERFHADLALFYNRYDKLQSLELGVPRVETSPALFLFVPQVFSNLSEGTSFGAELATRWRPSRRCELLLGYSFLDMDIHPGPTSTDPNAEVDEGRNPQHQLTARVQVDVADHWSLDGAAYYVDELPDLGIDSRTRVDLRAAWHPHDRLEISVALQNLLDDEHAEFTDVLVQPVLIERSAVAKVVWKF